MKEETCQFVGRFQEDPRQWLDGLSAFLSSESSQAKCLDRPMASLAFSEWSRRLDGLATNIRPAESCLGETTDENRRLREALTWAVGFIRCQLPKTSAGYPDMRNAESLIEGRSLISGEFQRQSIIAEFAESAMLRIQDVLSNPNLSWPVKESRIQAAITEYNDLVRNPDRGPTHAEQ